ncbi:MAG TPA: PVC-type heme-binding CxxCH protein, partial [Verrucomicrobiae bacterium]|nr:PVC-type heme-binding CxxCH protein [Verrucomicrobiae bacterium]
LGRGGGIVVLHDALGTHDPDWYKTVIGGAYNYAHSKFFEGDLSFYYQDHDHPITRGVSNFDFDDEEYYDLDMMPDAHVLAVTYQPDDRNKHDGRAFPSIYNVAPQMWTYEKDNYRAFVSIPGHWHKNFSLPHYRAVLLRGIAWAGKRDVDLLASKEELATLRYPAGGPTAPDEASKKIVLHPDFNLHLVASEPLIEKPISMDWDAQGRLWIAETPEYPFRKDRSRPPYDRISILESTRGDGRMDKKTIFYDGLDLVTSMVFYKDGVIVSQAPYILWVRDTHGKDKANKVVTLFKGFGTNDTHAVLSNLRWGMDGWIYATIGYTKGDIYSGDGKKHFGRIVDGVFRFKPDGSAIEQVSSKSSNTWGVDFAPDGEIFFSQANGNHIDHVVMPESALARGRVGNATSYLNIEDHNRSFPLMTWTKQAYVQIDWVGNFTAAAGCCIYDGGAWPEKYNYTHYVSDPTINLVHQDILKPRGVSYVASKDPERLEQEFVASTDLWFRPIHQRVGPDGALYILDFYNQAVVHNDTRGNKHDKQNNASIRPDRDHYFGRIWRVQHNDAKHLDVPNLYHAKPAALVQALEHPNEW